MIGGDHRRKEPRRKRVRDSGHAVPAYTDSGHQIPTFKARTRSELQMLGIELMGLIVPMWFKEKSDGCSVPTGLFRWVLDAAQTRSACFIHDFEYYLINTCYRVNTLNAKQKRNIADTNLKWNRQRIGKGPVRGWLFGRMYFGGVRIGGSRPLKRKAGKLVCPPTMEALEEIKAECKIFCGGTLTEYAQMHLQKWEKELKIR